MTVTSDCLPEEYVDRQSENSYFRLVVLEGKLTVDDRATVELFHHARSADNIAEIA